LCDEYGSGEGDGSGDGCCGDVAGESGET